MTIDGLVSTRQIREPVNSTDGIEAAYDGIIYRKGAGVLSMLEAYVGEESFRAGLRDYMRRFAFGSATVYDLMDSLQRVVGEGLEVEAVFESFLLQPGVPYLAVASRCDGATLHVDIEQSRYLPLGSRGDPAQRWTVPLCLAWGDGDEREDACVLLAEQHETFAFPAGERCPAWLLPNENGAGYLRWWVGNSDAEALAVVFQTQLNAAERISVADSIVAGVRAGSVSIPEFLAQLPALAGASEPDVVSQPLAVYRDMYHELLSPDARPAAGRYGVDTFGPLLAALNAGDASMPPADAAIMRYRLTRLLAVDIGAPDTVAMLTGIAHRYVGYPAGTTPDASVLDPDLLRPTLIAAVRDGDAAFITHLMQVFRESPDSRFRLVVMEALAFVTDPAIVNAVREFALGPDVRGTELSRWLYWILNPGSRSVNWPWVREHLGDILAAGNASIGRHAPDSFGHWLCSAEDADALEQIFSPYIEAYPGSETKLTQALETVALCSAFRAHQSEAANAYFLSRRN
jgi:alanyl aminopeptidase